MGSSTSSLKSDTSTSDAIACINLGIECAKLKKSEYRLLYYEIEFPKCLKPNEYKYKDFESVEELVKDAETLANGPFKIVRVGVITLSSSLMGAVFELTLKNFPTVNINYINDNNNSNSNSNNSNNNSN